MGAYTVSFRRILACLMVGLVLTTTFALAPAEVPGLFEPTPALAATTKQKIRNAYRKKVKKLCNANSNNGRRYSYYKFADVYGSSAEELLVVTPANGGSGNYLRIYTYKKGKVVLLLKDGWGSKCPDSWYRFYKKGKGFVMQRRGWGMENYNYYQLRGGKFKLVLTRGRQSTLGGATENGPWGYWDCINDKELTKAAFTKRARTIAKGSSKKISASWKWTLMSL